MSYVGQHGAESLRNYKYSGMDLSLTSKYLLQPIWSRFVYLFPLWVAPNLITLMGFGFIVASCILSYYYSPDLETPSPRWVYVFHGICLFLYQTFDAVDGKQARRTGSSSPLGELFDHGCDALAVMLECLTFATVVFHGRKILWSWFIASVTFYVTTWETFYTHTLILRTVNGPTEGLLLMYLAELWTAAVGPEWWIRDFRQALHIPHSLHAYLPGIPVNEFCIWIFVPTVTMTVFEILHLVRDAYKKRKDRIPYSPVPLVLPYFVLVGLTFLWRYLSPTDVINNYPYITLLSIGFAFSLQVGRLILAHLCDEYDGLLGALYMPLLLMPLAVANAYLGRETGGRYMVNELWLHIANMVYTASLYAHFALGVIRDVCLARNIYCLRLGPRQDTSKKEQ